MLSLILFIYYACLQQNSNKIIVEEILKKKPHLENS